LRLITLKNKDVLLYILILLLLFYNILIDDLKTNSAYYILLSLYENMLKYALRTCVGIVVVLSKEKIMIKYTSLLFDMKHSCLCNSWDEKCQMVYFNILKLYFSDEFLHSIPIARYICKHFLGYLIKTKSRSLNISYS
jgi:hypothetical protein